MPDPTPQQVLDPTLPDGAGAVHARDRRVLGQRGAATRSAILDAVAAHLRSTPWHRASVPALARDAGLTASSFYQYFPGLADAVRALCGDLARGGGPLPAHVGLIVALLDWEETHLGRSDEPAAGAVDGDA